MSSAPAPAPAPVQDILVVPSQWPESFPKPATGTRVLTYVFSQKDDSKVDVFVKYINSKFPNTGLSVVKDKDGFTSISITQVKKNTYPNNTGYTAQADSYFKESWEP